MRSRCQPRRLICERLGVTGHSERKKAQQAAVVARQRIICFIGYQSAQHPDLRQVLACPERDDYGRLRSACGSSEHVSQYCIGSKPPQPYVIKGQSKRCDLGLSCTTYHHRRVNDSLDNASTT